MIGTKPSATLGRPPVGGPDLFTEYHRTRDPRAREQLILTHEPLVRYLAAKFLRRGEPLEDLVQVGMIGLIHAIDRYEPNRGTRFCTYAIPTIVGEIKRYFRDKTWNVKVPRGLHDLNQRVVQANEMLAQSLGRSPTIPEIATSIGASEEATLQAMELGYAHGPLSLEYEFASDAETEPSSLGESLGLIDPDLQNLYAYGDVREAVACLDYREQRIIDLRFYQDLTQSEVAERLGISQMHVSRLQQRALHRLRQLLTVVDDDPRA